MMTRMELGRLLRLAERGFMRHKGSGFCELPHTCGGHHWWQGYIAACQDIRDGVIPTNLHSLVGESTPDADKAPQPNADQISGTPTSEETVR